NLAAKTISVYHTSDVHGWYSARPAKWDKENPTRMIGGFAALSALVKREKNPYILLDSGDIFQGTPEGNFTKGMSSVILMNQLGYSAVVAGNHEYDYGEDNLRVLVSSSSFPWLGANVYLKAGGKPVDYLKPYVIVEKAGKKIAVLGLAGKHTATSTLPANVKHLRFGDEAEEAAGWLPEIRKLNPDAVIILAHVGIGGNYGADKVDLSTWTLTGGGDRHPALAVARAAGGAQVVLGGHIHLGLTAGYFDRQSSALIGQSFWGLTDVSKVDLEFDDATGRFKGAKIALTPLWTDKTGEDAAVTETIKNFSESVNREMEKVIGESEADLGLSEAGLESLIGDWMTDAMRSQTGADVAIQNTSGIRADLKKGDIRMRDIYQVMPFENTAVILTMTGGQLHKLLNDNFRNGRARIQLSGLTVKFKLSPEGKTSGLSLEKDGKAINAADEFTVVTNNYLTAGGTGGKTFKEGKNMRDTMLPIRDLLVKEIKEHSPLKIPVQGRFVRLD
ncbi:MAG: bifunctional metallophosphatase/5'-nucleotidase, partial [Proteobacteria bacterium]|nr:bifunctional metallophosphatase/5'-nucleotidase [Pseudomonadota bacterium]